MTQFLSHDLWVHLQRLARDADRLVVVAPYYTDDSRVRCDSGDTLIVDAQGATIAAGQTSAPLLLAAKKRGATVLSHPRIHAKVVLGSAFAVVSSANVSRSSLTLREAGVLLTDPLLLAPVRDFIDDLKNEASELSLETIEELLSIPVCRNTTVGGRLPSILEALQDNLPALEDVAFGYWHGEATVSTEDVVDAAQELGLKLEPGWTHYDADNVAGVLETIRNACADVPYVEFEAEVSPDGRVNRFRANAAKARKFLSAKQMKGRIVAIYDRPGARTPTLDLSRDRKELAVTLTRGLRKASESLHDRINDPSGMIGAADLRKLFLLGVADGAR